MHGRNVEELDRLAGQGVKVTPDNLRIAENATLILSLHHDARFLRLPGALDRARLAFERMVTDNLAAPSARKRTARR